MEAEHDDETDPEPQRDAPDERDHERDEPEDSEEADVSSAGNRQFQRIGGGCIVPACLAARDDECDDHDEGPAEAE